MAATMCTLPAMSSSLIAKRLDISSGGSVHVGRTAGFHVAPVRVCMRTRAATAVCSVKREALMDEIRAMSTADIEEAVIDLKGELFLLRCQKARAPREYKPNEAEEMRRKVARMLTVKREREIQQGVSKRESRKLDFQWRKSVVPRPPPSLRKSD